MALILTTVSVGACKAVDTTTARQTFGGHIEFQLGGGIGGVRQSLSVYDDGVVIARDDKRRTEVRGQLDSARFVEINAAFTKIEARPDAGLHRLSRPCADCFQYTVTATINSVRHQVTIGSNALQASPYGELMALLSMILYETLSRAANDK